jgi:hypothetical protein
MIPFKRKNKNLLVLPVVIMFVLGKASITFSQTPSTTNTDESKTISYPLPDPLLMPNGKRVKTFNEWNKIQRPYIYHLFEEYVYGRYPKGKIPLRFETREQSGNALGGIATRKQVRIYFHPTDTTAVTDVLIYLPNSRKKPVPVFLSLNFYGNQTTDKDPAIFLPRGGVHEFKGVIPTVDSSRGIDPYWSIKDIILHGYGVVTAYYVDFEPDNKDGWKTGIRTTLKDVLKIQPDEWGAIGAWAWGVSRIMDYLEQDKAIDKKRVALVGHSRLGKSALWAGASDLRFAIVVANESGEGGAALSKRIFGETIKDLNQQFPHWFVSRYTNYNNNPDSLPVDQHMLLALIAPRPLYVASAEDDLWADPKGEFLSAVNAGPVYNLFGKRGIEITEMPAIHQPTGNTVMYHIRAGKHAITSYDWQQYMQFADRLWK